MSEGQVYLCKWKATFEGHEVWVENRPRLRARGESLDDALNELSGVVCLATGDGEAVFDLWPPSATEGSINFVRLGYNALWYPPHGFSREEYAELYEGGLCKACCSGIGARTDKPLPVMHLGDSDLLGSGLRLPRILLASQKFRAVLRKDERALLEWRPVELRRSTGRIYFEVIAKRPVKSVTDRAERVTGWQCGSCGGAVCGSGRFDTTYVAASDLPRPIPRLLAIDDPHLLKLTLRLQRWKAIRGKPGTKGIPIGNVVALPKSRVVRHPKLRMLTRSDIRAINKEFEWSRR
jgi:hypothetical protein